ncbi:dihydroxyacetone kinase subunit DhaK [Clostridium saudiense]|uniref:dihydroxyacetone kinase subunit DhaK n=1 Tax=Clostridium saudiense TaxID=1414720 RepID=UPI0008226CD5|nr:dihydroxyacetone kinase subunit DhaK [Clostridium saudiense]MDU7453710.1 dihydroxyacetone kinase subunit DhaK [Clostridium saudiense]MEE0725078.1 dihydroxyacetone kinase subunit DhaK [Clostridium saudiense]SCJ86975.1 PTS-dependent dihydroxyacetone kinase%2C dihydroxyacetone-binding subunit dhaK [uncultured Clostridium sp.]
MNRFINNPDYVVDDMIKGYVKAHSALVSQSTRNSHVVKYKNAPVKGKVGIVTGGGSGHEPAFLGYVGRNMVDAVAVGEVFSSPPAQAFYDAIIEADSGEGVACLFGNYAGDTMNVKMAQMMADEDEIIVKTVIANDDIASSPKETKEKRHGIAGGVFMWKVGGAKAALGGTLDEVIESAQKAIDNTRSICVGLSPCVIPAVGKPNFQIEDGKMEFGVGHHGEPGLKVEDIKLANEIAREMTDSILDDMDIEGGSEVSVIVSGLGSTPLMELYILYDEIEKCLKENEISVYKVFVGNYVTSLDMNGAALTIMKLDKELKELLDFEAESKGIEIH